MTRGWTWPERGDGDAVGEVEVGLAVGVEQPVAARRGSSCARSSDRGRASGWGGRRSMVGSGSCRMGRPSISSASHRPDRGRAPGRVAGLGRVRCGHGRLHPDRREQARPRERPRVRRGRDPAVHPRVGREGRGPSRGLRAGWASSGSSARRSPRRTAARAWTTSASRSCARSWSVPTPRSASSRASTSGSTRWRSSSGGPRSSASAGWSRRRAARSSRRSG